MIYYILLGPTAFVDFVSVAGMDVWGIESWVSTAIGIWRLDISTIIIELLSERYGY